MSESDNGEHRSNAGSKMSALALNHLFPKRKTNLKCENTLERICLWELAGTDETQHMGFVGLNELTAGLCIYLFSSEEGMLSF